VCLRCLPVATAVKERLKCFDGLLGATSKPEHPQEGTQANWSIDETKSPSDGSPQVVAANLVNDTVLILRCNEQTTEAVFSTKYNYHFWPWPAKPPFAVLKPPVHSKSASAVKTTTRSGPRISSADGSSSDPHPPTGPIGKMPPRPLEMRSGLWRIIRCGAAELLSAGENGALS
jgi:hypothetical protein